MCQGGLLRHLLEIWHALCLLSLQVSPGECKENLSMTHHRHKHQHSDNSTACPKIPLVENLAAALNLSFMIPRSHTLLPSPSPLFLASVISQSYYPCLLARTPSAVIFSSVQQNQHMYLHSYLREKKKKIIQSAIFGSFTPLSHHTDK